MMSNSSQPTSQPDPFNHPAPQPTFWTPIRQGIAGVLVLATGIWIGTNYHIRVDTFPLTAQTNSWRVPVLLVEKRGSESIIDDPLVNRVRSLLESKYLGRDELDRETLLYGAVKGMVDAAGDPYTAFFDPGQNQDAKDQLAGTYEGIGAQLGFKDKQLVVVAPLKNSPAGAAGVRAGDALLKIDEQDTAGISLAEAVDRIRGKAGTAVKLTIGREGETQPRSIDITRQQITIESVELTFKDNPASIDQDADIAYLKLNRFGDTTIDEWNRAVTEIKNRQAKSVVLDMRDNPGGYLQAAIHIASEFFTDGVVVGEQRADGSKENYNVNHVGRLTDIPVVVLVNKGSASASEIVAGALQSRNRAQVVGENSFGKGSVQEVVDLPEGTSLHVTIAKWLLPNGQNIDKVGIKPNQVVELTAEDAEQERDPQLEAAIKELTK